MGKFWLRKTSHAQKAVASTDSLSRIQKENASSSGGNSDQFGSEILRFLASPDAEVLCITGKWGVGKTFAWKHYLKIAQTNKIISLDNYSYVSLFGREVLEDVKTAIVENTVDSHIIETRPNIDNFRNSIGHATAYANEIKKLASYFPTSSGWAGGLNRLIYLNLHKQIICFDDLERSGKNLESKSIMGIVSELKEEKKCKVVILLNKDESQDTNLSSFEEQLEKVADIVLNFNPTIKQAVEIGLDQSSPHYASMSRCITILQITNIRVIKQIERICGRAIEIIAEIDERIINQAISTLALLTFSKLQPDQAPSMDFIIKYNRYGDLLGKDNKDDPVSRKRREDRNFLQSYDFGGMDEFDQSLLDGINNGYFDIEKLKAEADKLRSKIDIGDKNALMRTAWDIFHGSFKLNEDEFIDTLLNSARISYEIIDPTQLSSVMAVMKEFNKEELAAICLREYMDKNADKPHEFLGSVI